MFTVGQRNKLIFTAEKLPKVFGAKTEEIYFVGGVKLITGHLRKLLLRHTAKEQSHYYHKD